MYEKHSHVELRDQDVGLGVITPFEIFCISYDNMKFSVSSIVGRIVSCRRLERTDSSYFFFFVQ